MLLERLIRAVATVILYGSLYGDDDAAAPRPGGGSDGCKTPLACLHSRPWYDGTAAKTRATCTPILPTRMHEFLNSWCEFFYLIMGILSYCTFHHVYVQIALTEVHSRS